MFTTRRSPVRNGFGSSGLAERPRGPADRPCRVFAYPNGDFVPSPRKKPPSAGYEVAFTTRVAPIDATTSRYLLPRLAAPHSLRRFVQVDWWQDPVSPGPGPSRR